MKFLGRLIFTIIVLLFFGYVGFELGVYIKDWISEYGYPAGKRVQEKTTEGFDELDSHSEDKIESLELFPATGYWIGGDIKDFFYSVNNP